MAMDVPTLMAAMATKIGQIQGVKKAWSVPPNSLSNASLPGVVMFWDGQSVTRVEPSNASGGTMWIATVRADILLPRKGDTPQEFVNSRELITPIIDAFAGPIREVLPGLESHVDRCMPTQARGDVLISYAGQLHMGAQVYFDIKFHRRKTA